MLEGNLNRSVAVGTRVMTDDQRQVFALVNYVILAGFVSLFGSVANVINTIVFYRQGLDTTINISFFSLAISDLCSLLVQQFYNIFINPLFLRLNLPIVYGDFQYMSTGLNREMFARITCLVTAFITAERCLCVVFPLHVKRIITPKLTATVIVVIFISSVISPVPLFFTSYHTWMFFPDTNRSLLRVVGNSHNGIAEAIFYLSHGVLTLVGFMSVLTLTLILIYKLGQKNEWRQTAKIEEGKARTMSKRDRATITMVVLIACILVVCYTPAVLLCFATFIVPTFTVNGIYHNIWYSLWSFGLLFENINSSINIFLYYKMSSKYRQMFRELFYKCFKTNKDRNVSSKSVP